MRILVVGNGGRECAIANTLLVSPKVTRLYITPENFGVVDPFDGGRVFLRDIPANDVDALLRFARSEEIHLTVVGPEAPLALGIVDSFRAEGMRIVGPEKRAAMLEASKSFAKSFMDRFGIPTAKWQAFEDYQLALESLKDMSFPLVVKADGLAAGKGVIVCNSYQQASDALTQMMVKQIFGPAGEKVVIEEFLSGKEISFFCFFDGKDVLETPPVTDYKRLLDGDNGPNTGGMGCICPSPFATSEVISEWREKILKPFINGCEEMGFDYRGVIYFGTIITESGLKVLEFNVRLGDPEAQAILPLLCTDLVDVLVAMESGKIVRAKAKFSDEATVTVVLASKNYPYASSPPAKIEGLERVAEFLSEEDEFTNGSIFRRLPKVNLFFAGVSKGRTFVPDAVEEGDISDVSRILRRGEEREEYFATGGRVLGVTARGKDLSDARRLAYEVVGNIHFEGMQFRTDIGKLR